MSGLRSLSPPTRPELAICWPSLDEEERAYQLQTMTEWLDWLVPTFALDSRTLPPCWREHGALREELSALYTAWTVAYSPTSGVGLTNPSGDVETTTLLGPVRHYRQGAGPPSRFSRTRPRCFRISCGLVPS